MGMTRFSINAILWFGDEMRKFDGVVPGDDEEFMSCIYPTKHGMSNAWNGDAIVAHFAFSHSVSNLISGIYLNVIARCVVRIS